MLSDEKVAPVMRKYNPDAKYYDHFYAVFNYYFNECSVSIQQRPATIHLAMAYFTQMIMMDKVHARDIQILIAVCILLASKLDEIDYNLPSFDYILHHMKNSKYLINYSLKFSKQHYVIFEEITLKMLRWNLSQITPYHCLQALIAQGIVLSHEKCRIDNSDTIEKSDLESSDLSSEYCDVAPTTGMRRPYGVRSRSSKRSQLRTEDAMVKGKSYSSKKLAHSKTSKTDANSNLREIDITLLIKVRQCSEYFVKLSALVLETQKYTSSKVA